MKSTKYMVAIMATADYILSRGQMAEQMRVQQTARKLEILRHRDKTRPARAGIPLPKFLERYV
jgi:hypothetical protein